MWFRQLPELKMLTLTGNPICEEVDYRMTVFAYVSNLKYLDYAVIDPVDVHTAKEQVIKIILCFFDTTTQDFFLTLSNYL